jgi:hypothetical protein
LTKAGEEAKQKQLEQRRERDRLRRQKAKKEIAMFDDIRARGKDR